MGGARRPLGRSERELLNRTGYKQQEFETGEHMRYLEY